MKPNQQITFHPFRLDLGNQCLWREEHAVPLTLKAFALLRYLAERPGQLATKGELLEAVWPETFVTDAVLKVRIGELRKALGDEAKTPCFIETAQRRGYRFIGKVTMEPERRRDDRPPSLSLPVSPSPLVVGRAAELAHLQGRLEHVLGGQRQIVFVTGEPGIGKTTLVEAFLREADASLLIARGQCLEQYGDSEAYLPWLDAFSRLCREREACIALLRRRAPMWLAQMPWLLDEAERAALQRETAGATRARMLREMAEAIEGLTAETPLVLALEDLHWSDYSTLDLIAYLARRSEPARLLLIGTYRPVEVILSGHPLKGVKQELQTHQLCAELPLDFLSEAAVAEYLRLRFPTQQFPADLPRLIHGRTDGNALFMVNVVDDLLAHSLIDEAGQRSEFKAAVEEIEVATPAGVRQMIEKQIERLSEADQRVLEAASVGGVEFSSVAVAAGLQAEVIEIEECCERLARHQQFLREAGLQSLPDGTVTARYGFIHALYQNAFYQRVTAARRAGLHQRIGEHDEVCYGQRAAEIAAELALHFEQGRDWQRAVKYLTQAAQQANQVFAAQEAVVLARRGLALAAMLPEVERCEQELSLQIVLGNALMATKGFAAPEVEQTYSRARELCHQLGQTPNLLPVLYGLFANQLVSGRYRRALKLGVEFLALAEQESDPATVVGHRMMGLPLFALGELTQAREHLEQIAFLYDPAQHRRLTWLYGQEPGIAGHAFLALTLWLLGYPESALRRHQEALNLAREVCSHAQSQAYALTWATMHHQFRREYRETREAAEAIITLATEQGLALWLAWGAILHGWAMAMQGQAEEGIGQMTCGLENMQSTETQMFRPYYLCLLAEGYGKAGEFREGLAVLAEALAPSEKIEEHFCEAELYRLKGELLLLEGTDAAEVEACFQHAIEVARKQSAKSFELRAVMSLNRLWQRQGRQAEARELLSHTYRWFTEGFDTADLQAAKLLLEELA